ncbi:MAG: pilus (MSHA type) biogenesis protein MshL [Rhodocyclaceae bacterium]|nr:pilus (MSHA type) biogenesis protein MshL [Rhodocyclaceae bacterium]
MPPVTFPVRASIILVAASLSACSALPPQKPSAGHLQAEPARAENSNIPALVGATAAVQRPKPAAKVETYSVSVRNVPVGELLFALSRDAKLNIDLHPGIEGTVSINAIDQTLQQILTRLSKQVDMRWELNGPNLAIMPDAPFLRTYRIDYVNMARDMKTKTEVSSQVGTGSSGGGGGNTSIESTSKNRFWETLDKNIQDLLRETDKVLPEGSSETVIDRTDQQSNTTGAIAAAATKAAAGAGQNAATGVASQQTGNTVVKRSTFREAASVISNPEAGVISVRASSRQHEKIQEFLDQVMGSSRRQVMIEATIVEVALNNQYEQGINWQSLRSIRGGTAGFSVARGQLSRANGLTTATTVTTTTATGNAASGTTGTATSTGSTTQDVVGGVTNIGKAFLLNYVAPGLGISSTIDLLETFGNVKVLSSPKISVLNNQTAVIKVVDNLVYFTVKSDTTNSTSGPSQTTVTTTPNSVAVGLVMSITPQISESNTVLLNVRPVISRLNGPGKIDPNPSIPANIQNIVPEISTREMESMLRLTDGETAVMGGLMSESIDKTTSSVPGFSSLPGIGALFTSHVDVIKKTELVIFLKPIIIREPSIYGDYRNAAGQLPDKEFFSEFPPSPSNSNTGVGKP